MSNNPYKIDDVVLYDGDLWTIQGIKGPYCAITRNNGGMCSNQHYSRLTACTPIENKLINPYYLRDIVWYKDKRWQVQEVNGPFCTIVRFDKVDSKFVHTETVHMADLTKQN